MSTPPVPSGLPRSERVRVANRLHSLAIHLLRRARTVDRQTGLSPERLSLLSVLAFAGPRTMSELAQAEMVSRPAITRIVKALESRGLVERQSDTADRRRVVLRATRRGRRIMERGRGRRVAYIADELRGFSKADMRILSKATAILDARV